jgi:isopropylmalate/homocitrate/citramalate synthase
VGRDDFRFVYGKGAGAAAMAQFLKDLGITATEEQQAAILDKLKTEAALRKAFLDEAEFRHLVGEVIGR